jgi:hypothetical protein
MRPCVDCKELKINKNEPPYKDRCFHCFKVNKDHLMNTPMRECSQCKESNIPTSKPDFQTICGKCYKLSLQPKEVNKNEQYIFNIKSKNECEQHIFDIKTNKNFGLLSSMMIKK